MPVPRPEMIVPPQPVLAGSGATVSSVPSTGTTAAAAGVSSTGQPVEFNHAIQYVNKIKVC